MKRNQKGCQEKYATPRWTTFVVIYIRDIQRFTLSSISSGGDAFLSRVGLMGLKYVTMLNLTDGGGGCAQENISSPLLSVQKGSFK